MTAFAVFLGIVAVLFALALLALFITLVVLAVRSRSAARRATTYRPGAR